MARPGCGRQPGVGESVAICWPDVRSVNGMLYLVASLLKLAMVAFLTAGPPVPVVNTSLPLVPAAAGPPGLLRARRNIKRPQLSVLGRVPLCREPRVCLRQPETARPQMPSCDDGEVLPRAVSRLLALQHLQRERERQLAPRTCKSRQQTSAQLTSAPGGGRFAVRRAC